MSLSPNCLKIFFFIFFLSIFTFQNSWGKGVEGGGGGPSDRVIRIPIETIKFIILKDNRVINTKEVEGLQSESSFCNNDLNYHLIEEDQNEVETIVVLRNGHVFHFEDIKKIITWDHRVYYLNPPPVIIYSQRQLEIKLKLKSKKRRYSEIIW